MENEGYLTIYKHLTFFRLFPDNKDHRFDYYKNIDFQEEITEIITIKYANYYRMKFSIYEELVTYLNNAYGINNPLVSAIRYSADGRDYLYKINEWYSKLFRLIKNYKYKYGLSFEITHEIFPMIQARRTNCNLIEERYIHFLLQKYTSYNERDIIYSSLHPSTAKRITNFLFNNPHVFETKHLKLYFWEFKLLIGEESPYFDHKYYLDIIFRVLKSLGIKAELKDGHATYYTPSCKRLIALYKQGYNYHPQEPDDKHLFDDEIIRKYKLKKVKYNYLKLFKSKEF